jgi:hypothetical protein
MKRVFGLNVLTDKELGAFATRHRTLGIISGRNDISRWAIKLKRMEMNYALLAGKYDAAMKENTGLKAVLNAPPLPNRT